MMMIVNRCGTLVFHVSGTENAIDIDDVGGLAKNGGILSIRMY